MKNSLWSALLFILGSGLTASLLVARQSGFGAGDLPAFFFWIGPIAVLVALAAPLIDRLLARLSRVLRFVVTLLTGFLFGLLASFVPVIFLGPWAMAFSFPLPVPMIAGGLAAFASFATVPTGPRGRKYLLDASLMVAFAVTFTFLSEPVYDLLESGSRVKVTLVEWQTASPSSMVEDPRHMLSQEEEQKIGSLGLEGKLLPLSQFSRGEEPQVHMLVILQSHMAGSVDLPIPARDAAIYVVTQDQWRMLPEGVALSDLFLHLEMPGSSNGDYGSFRLQHGDGSESGGSFVWYAPAP